MKNYEHEKFVFGDEESVIGCGSAFCLDCGKADTCMWPGANRAEVA